MYSMSPTRFPVATLQNMALCWNPGVILLVTLWADLKLCLLKLSLNVHILSCASLSSFRKFCLEYILVQPICLVWFSWVAPGITCRHSSSNYLFLCVNVPLRWFSLQWISSSNPLHLSSMPSASLHGILMLVQCFQWFFFDAIFWFWSISISYRACCFHYLVSGIDIFLWQDSGRCCNLAHDMSVHQGC